HERYPADVKCLSLLYLYVGRYPRNNASRNNILVDNIVCHVATRGAEISLSPNRPLALFTKSLTSMCGGISAKICT
ncbi:MAG: hypothetical protein BECKG1743E_GA0114224_105491, partial [Candidatus Kentron sp. G]